MNLKSQFFRICAAVAISCCFMSQSATANDTKVIQIVNDTGRAASCVQFYVRNTNGNLTINPDMIVGGPYAPQVRIQHLTPYAVVKLDWGRPVIRPRDAVTAVLQTTNGPMILRSGFWCVGDRNLGPIGIASGEGPTRGPGGSFLPLPPRPSLTTPCKIVIQLRCNGPTIYTPWFKGPPRIAGRSFCWWRWCCRPAYELEYRFLFCCFPNSPACVFGANTFCVPLTNWQNAGTVPGKYEWQFTSIKPKDAPVIEWNIFGPPKNASRNLAAAGIGTIYSKDVFVSAGDRPFTESIDLSSAFQTMAAELVPSAELDANLPRPDSFEAVLRLNGTPWINASKTVNKLSRALRSALVSSPNSEFRPFYPEFVSITRATNRIGNAMSAGRPPAASDVEQLVDSYRALAELTSTVGDKHGHHRFGAAASSYTRLADALQVALVELRRGLPDVGSRDDFLWGMLIGARTAMRDVGIAHEAHTRIRFGLADHQWDSNTMAGAVLTIHNREGDFIDHFDVPVSDNNDVFLPFLGNISDDGIFVATLKLPGCLAESFVLSSENDGNAIRIPTIINGDVDDNNCIDEEDFALVRETIGDGGQDAEFVPSTDVNANGIVDRNDARIVRANNGKCGDD